MKVVFELDNKYIIHSYRIIKDNPDFSKSKNPKAAQARYNADLERCVDIEYSQLKNIIFGQSKYIYGHLEIGKDLTDLKKELADIQMWFSVNDWKVNKISLGEWSAEDPRTIEYLNERKSKRIRQDELNKFLI